MSLPAGDKNHRILIVDDNRAIHEDFKKVLSSREGSSTALLAAEEALFGDSPASDFVRNSFELESAFQGKDALEIVKKSVEQGCPYAMAFVDVQMPPGWDGVETTQRLWEVDPDLHVVICTAYSDYSWDEMLRKLKQSDRLVILKKPFDNIEVLQLANSLTSKWHLVQQAKDRMADLEQVVAARTAQVVREQEKLKAIFENSPEGIFQTTDDGRYVSANPALAQIYGYKSPSELMESLTDIGAQLYAESGRRDEFKRLMNEQPIVRDFESEIICRDGSRKWISETACKIIKLDGSLLYYQGFVVDITTEKDARRERDLMEIHLRQAQKLESVGQLAAGIAHEINTPIQYIGDNIRFVDDSFSELIHLLGDYEKLAAAAQSDTLTPELLESVQNSSKSVDVAYLNGEVPAAIRQSLDGVKHVADIVRAMKEFSHPGSLDKTPLNLAEAIQTTLTVARNEWKYVATVSSEFEPDLPKVPCVAGEFNQVILNLVVNAAHAIGDVVKDTPGVKGKITVTAHVAGPWVEIRISDTGAGIPEKIRHQIFEPFFTTKEVGKGTGQGLAIARAIIVKKHGGQIEFESTVGKGATFIVRIPLNAAAAPSPATVLAA